MKKTVKPKKIKNNNTKPKITIKKGKEKIKQETEKIKNKTNKIKKDYQNMPKEKKKSLWNKLLIVILSLFVMMFIIGIIFMVFIVVKAPKFNPDNFYRKEASILYDNEGKIFASLGTEKREKVNYSALPEVLIDAIVATEDSRFFEHNGFDIARFAKASFGQVLGKHSGGASTLTMQVAKNNLTSTESSGIAGIIRKFSDIYLSIFKIEKNYTKEQIIEFYVNAPYLGSGAYGVEQASRVYFGKSIQNLNLAEASLIAGLFQAPGAYDPYVNPKNAENRRNIVLSLMERHGYISKEERQITEKIKVKDLLIKKGENVVTTVNPYQGYIDTVVKEIIKETKNNPYDIPMEVFTTMDRKKQDGITEFYNGENYKFKDDLIKIGISAIDTKSGAIVAIGAGRNKTKELTFNYATMTDKHPGSTAKPIFDYAPAFECMKWSTYGPVFDEPISYSGKGGTVHNWNNKYKGLMSAKDALAQSINTAALETFQKQKDTACRADIIRKLNIRAEWDKNNKNFLHESHALGAFTGVSPLELSAAYAAFSNGGYYTKPYSYTKIIYRDSGKIKEKKPKKVKVFSEETAYMITDMLVSATTNNSVHSTQVATKTGTSSYDNEVLKAKGISLSAIQASWVSFYSPDTAVAFIYGYDKLMKDKYITMNSGAVERGKIQRALTKALVEPNKKFTKPNSLSSVTVEFETIPAELPSEYTPDNLKKSFLFFKGTEPTEISKRFNKLSNPNNLKIVEDSSKITANWSKAETPIMYNPITLKQYFDSGYGNHAEKYFNQRLEYNKNNIGKFGYDIYAIINGKQKYIGWTEKNEYTFNAPSGTTEVLVKTSYSIFKANQSDGIKEKTNSIISDSITCTLVGEKEITKNIGTGFYNLADLNPQVKIKNNDTDITNVTNIIKIIKNAANENKDKIDLSINDQYTIKYQFTYNDKVYTDTCPTRTIIVE